MKAVILAGGEGTRLRSVTGDLPKPMVPLAGKPVMERIIELLRAQGFWEICAALCYHPEPIMAHFGDGSAFGVQLEYRLETEPRGTAGSVLACRDFYQDEDFLIISGDAACDFDLRGLMERHRQADAAVTMALFPNAEPLQYGLVLQDKLGFVRHFIEKPDWEHVVTDMVNTGIYVLSPRAMAYVPEGEKFDFAKDLFPLLLECGERILGVPMDGYWCDIGTPRAYYQCSLDVLDGKLGVGAEATQDTSQTQTAQASDKSYRAVPCRDRARLMRTASEALMEFGADFTDGLSFRDGSWDVHVHPAADANEVRVEAETAEAADSTARLLELMEQNRRT